MWREARTPRPESDVNRNILARCTPPRCRGLSGGGATVNIVAHLDNPGQWMAHCHILEHAELGMMSEIVVEPR